MNKKRALLILGFIILPLLASCGSKTYAPLDPPTKTVEVKSDKALVVIYFDSIGLDPHTIVLDGKDVVAGLIRKQKTFYYASPGHHIFAAAVDNTLPFGGLDFKFVEGDLEAGKVYYIGTHSEHSFVFPASLLPAVPYIQAPTMQDYAKNDSPITRFLLINDAILLNETGYAWANGVFRDDEDRYDEQLADWLKLDKSKRVQMRATELKQSEVKLHNGKWM